MLYSILAVGDVVGESGLAHLEHHLRPLQKLKNISFTVVNGENISAVGLTCKQAWRVYDAGADAVTLGNHTFGKMEICRMLDETPWLLRPANLSGGCQVTAVRSLTSTACGIRSSTSLAGAPCNGTQKIPSLWRTGCWSRVPQISPWLTSTRRPPVKN